MQSIFSWNRGVLQISIVQCAMLELRTPMDFYIVHVLGRDVIYYGHQ